MNEATSGFAIQRPALTCRRYLSHAPHERRSVAVLGADGTGPPVVTIEHGQYRDRGARTGDAELVSDRPGGSVRWMS
jgi:hypothetical protein